MSKSFTAGAVDSINHWRGSVEYWAKSEKQWASWTWLAETERVKNVKRARSSRMFALRSLRSEYRVLRSAVRAD